MRTNHLLGLALIAAGGIGIFNRYQISSGTTAPTTGLAAYTGTFDPAGTLLGLPATSTTFDAGMIVDIGIVGIGVWLLSR